MRKRVISLFSLPSTLAVILLIALWGLYFWRIFTPNEADALSLTDGDFSGQFVAFMGYQTTRLAEGKIPLWNPYNFAGHPFLADTQSAVFYPPRLLTVGVLGADPAPSAIYAALQTEMALHVLLGTLLMYAFVRRVIARGGASGPVAAVGGVVAALTYGYGGYVSGYPQLQLAVLEAGVWLPLVLLGLFEATESGDLRANWRCIVLAGTAMGLSLLAGHPQTSYFMLLIAVAFLAVRLWPDVTGCKLRPWLRRLIPAVLLFGVVAGGLAAVQLLPGLEYLQHTTRATMSVDAKGNGFPFADLAQIILPGYLTEWSPLYVGISGLALIAWAIWQNVPYSRYFGGVALIGLGWSFGAGTVIYDAVYVLLPGANWFRGQERAAFIVAQSASVLAGLGAAHLLQHIQSTETKHFERGLIGLLAGCGLLTGGFFVLAQQWEDHADALQAATFATILAALTLVVFRQMRRWDGLAPAAVLIALIVFDLFSVTLGATNYDPVPAGDRLPEPALIAELGAALPPGARIDGTRGLGPTNYGTLYAVPDIHGISPLELGSIHAIRTELPPGRMWDLLAVDTVLSDWEELPVPSTITATADDGLGSYNAHHLDDPRGFAHLTYGATVVGADAEAYGLLREPGYDTRQWAIVDRNPYVDLPGSAPDTPGTATITRFEPEEIVISVETPTAAILTLALPHYPGWHVTLSSTDVDSFRANPDILRAYGGLSAVALPVKGTYTVRLTYRPWTFTVGAVISVITLLALLVVALSGIWARRSHHPA